MRFAALAPLFAILLATACPPRAAAQSVDALRIVEVAPYDRAAPGQIMELRVEGFAERFTSPPPGDALQILVTQDGSTLKARARTATPTMKRESRPAQPGGSSASAPPEMRMLQAVTFVVPRGLHAGEAEVVVSYRNRRSAPHKLNVVERPQRPVVGSAGVMTIAPASLPPPVRAGGGATRSAFGLKFERGAKGVEMHVRPLSDPEDAEAGVLVRFKQGGTYFESEARVVHRAGGREDMSNGGFRLMPARDVLEVDVPELLAPGEAEVEVSLRAAGQTGDAVLVPVTITDAARAYESPKEAAPRMLAVTPRRVGAGQALMISVDRRRALDPDPSKAAFIFEAQDGTRRTVSPEMNSALRDPAGSPDAPALLIVRAPEGITGPARVRLLNPARADYEGAASEPAQVEIVAETIAPELLGAAEASKDELSQLRQLAEAQKADPRVRPIYDPAARYVSIRATGLDYSPKFLRVRMEQEGRGSVTLGRGDFALFSNNALIVRVPKEFGAGATRVSVENRGAAGYSAPVSTTLELSARP